MLSQAVDATSERILDAARSVTVTAGPSAVTVSAIAEAAGLSRMTVYRKFDDRRAILSALFNRELAGIVDDADGTGPAPERIVAMVTRSVARLNANPLMEAVLQHAPDELTPWMTERLGVTQRRAHALLRDLIIEGQSDGSVRDGDADEMALTLVLVAQAFVFGHRIGGSPHELRQLVRGYLA